MPVLSDIMEIKIWGCTGSTPTPRALADLALPPNTPERFPLTFGGDTACVQIILEGSASFSPWIFFDAGSGLTTAGKSWSQLPHEKRPKTFHIFFSHFHGDHLQGLPFFEPIYSADVTLHFYASHEGMEGIFEKFFAEPFFPVPWKSLPSKRHYHTLPPLTVREVEGLNIRSFLQNHPGRSYAYRIESPGHSIVYATDSEYPDHKTALPGETRELFRHANLAIMDTHLGMRDPSLQEPKWGHGSIQEAFAIAQAAGVQRVCLFHHDPKKDDAQLHQLARSAEALFQGSGIEVFPAYDGLSFFA